MKHNAMARGCRLDLSLAELRSLVGLAQRGARSDVPGSRVGAGIDGDLIAGLSAALDAQSRKADQVRHAAAERRESRTRPDRVDRTRNHYAEHDGFTVTATRGDFVDTSPLPYHRTWSPVDDSNQGAQGELRRDVWCLHVHTRDMYRDFVGHGVTDSADRDEIEPVAQRIYDNRFATY